MSKQIVEYEWLQKEREWLAKGRRLGFFNDFKLPKWLKSGIDEKVFNKKQINKNQKYNE